MPAKSYQVSSTVKAIVECVLPPEGYKGGVWEFGPQIVPIEALLVKAVGQGEPRLAEIAEELIATCFVPAAYQGKLETLRFNQDRLREILREVARDGYTPTYVSEPL